MDMLCVKSLWTNKQSNYEAGIKLFYQKSSCGKSFGSPYFSPNFSHTEKCRVRSLANQKSVKRLKREKKDGNSSTQQINTNLENEYDDNDNLEKDYITIPSRDNVLQACTTTSGIIAALGILIRQVSHVVSNEGLSVVDCTTEISYGRKSYGVTLFLVSFPYLCHFTGTLRIIGRTFKTFNCETWHLQMIAGIVVLISSCRYLLLNTWPDFAESSEAANQQVLSPLQPLDYIIVAFLSGISEELLFRGALLPLFGVNWRSAMLVGAIFGVLHLGNGRKYSFAIWATFVGFVYGYATVISSSLIVPMASHAANNLVGGLLWRYSSKSQK